MDVLEVKIHFAILIFTFTLKYVLSEYPDIIIILLPLSVDHNVVARLARLVLRLRSPLGYSTPLGYGSNHLYMARISYRPWLVNKRC
jgi:hypothetical protein